MGTPLKDQSPHVFILGATYGDARKSKLEYLTTDDRLKSAVPLSCYEPAGILGRQIDVIFVTPQAIRTHTISATTAFRLVEAAISRGRGERVDLEPK